MKLNLKGNRRKEILTKIAILSEEQEIIQKKAELLKEMYEDLQYEYGELETRISSLHNQLYYDEREQFLEDIGMEEWEIDALFE